MRFAIALEHEDFFRKNHFIEFDHLLTQEESELLKTHATTQLATLLKKKPEELIQKKPLELFMAGRDLWKTDPVIKKTLLHPRMNNLAISLFKKNPLRLAYDQFIFTSKYPESPYREKLSLQQNSCFNNVVGGLILRLSFDSSSLPEEPCPIPRNVGNGVFLDPTLPIPYETLFQTPNQCFYLIVYCADKTLYKLEKRDLHTHALKREGYAFGDFLRNHTHPLLNK